MKSELILVFCIALLAVSGEANKNKNRRSFFDFWDSEDAAATAVSSEDLTFEDKDEGSGMIKENTHGDDEDFDDDDEVDGSGDGLSNQKINLPDEEDPDDDIEIEEESDDEDMVEGSASGDYSEEVIEKVIVPDKVHLSNSKPTPSNGEPLTPCESYRNAALEIAPHVTSIPECDKDGNFTRLQCVKDKSMCWCVDEKGGEIPGTNKKHPQKPDCDFGENLSTCVFQLVQHSMKAINAYKPKCTLDGKYEPVQCQETGGKLECWCVDAMGNEMLGSVTTEMIPKCEEFDKKPQPDATPKPVGAIIPTGEGYNVDSKEEPDKDIDVFVAPIDIDDDSSKMEEVEEENHSINDKETQHGTASHVKETTLFAQPGLLAAIIGATVVGLLCIVLLVMFLVYRMRKKDEGSYPLEEQKYPNYQYTKAPEKEFYA